LRVPDCLLRWLLLRSELDSVCNVAVARSFMYFLWLWPFKGLVESDRYRYYNV
jgi:hypothetical protein